MSPAGAPRPVAVLISGRGSNMRTLIERGREPESGYAVVKVFSDQPAAAGLRVAAELGVPAQAIAAPPAAGGNPRARAAFDRDLADAVAACSPALLALAGFMRILSPEFVARFAGRILNIHPSLLPNYPGLHTHERVLAAGDAEHGATVHYVTDGLDLGPAVIQARVAVAPGDDAAGLAARVQAVEHLIYPLAVRWHCEGRLEQRGGAAWLDGAPLRRPVQLADLHGN